ncbi:MAG TPA: hypothetical protein RMH99_00885 [Sandaracinaceae bacterium LLY-WYZ-13_1]|nr:hypothetical protein [Sandaracinaceae bacterium LLY-WYZ-13_1]
MELARVIRRSSSVALAVASVAVGGAVAWAEDEAEEGGREVPAELVPVLNAAQRALEADDPRAALRILGSYEGEPDPLQKLLAAYAHMDLDQPDQAETAFRAALDLDGALEQARTGLARSLVAQEKWSGAIEILRTVVDVDRSSAIELGLYARSALESGDLRLASLLAERGLLRFPEDMTLRRIDVEVLVRREAWSDAMEAALGILAREPADRLAWRQLAAAADRAAPELGIPALEAATLAAPDDWITALRLARRLYDLGDHSRVLELVEDGLRRAPNDVADDWRRLGMAAAVQAGRYARAAAWSSARVVDGEAAGAGQGAGAVDGEGAGAGSDLAMLVEAHRLLDAGSTEAALEAFAKVAARRRLPSETLWSLVETARDAGRPGLKTFFARATLARCDTWAPAAAAVLATEAARDLAPETLLTASCGT